MNRPNISFDVRLMYFLSANRKKTFRRILVINLALEKLQRRNCPSKKIFKKNREKRATENRVGWNSELGSRNASGWSSPKAFKNCLRNAPINYRQTMPEDRFTLVKMNITRSRNHDYKWHFYKMSFKRKSWIFTK